jgi:SAM-dependent methyltransferase
LPVANEWWRTFFSGLSVDLWLHLPTEEHTQQEASFIEKMLEAPPGAEILDVPCGGGRHSVALARRGYRVTGVDISRQFLDAARALAADAKLQVEWHERDMRDLPWPGRFLGAICFGNSFGYYDDAGTVEFVQALARVLKPGARFVLDTGNVAECLLPSMQPNAWMQAGDIYFLQAREYDHVRGRVDSHYTFIRGGRVEKSSASQRTFTYRELCRLFENAGFRDLHAYSSPALEPFKLGSRRLLLVATRR